MDVVITTYNRLKYLRPTLLNLMKEAVLDNHYYIVDGGSNDGTVEYIRELYKEEVLSGYSLYKDNIGADILKSRGAQRFIEGDRGMISSDDLEYPPAYDHVLNFMYDELAKDNKIYGVMAKLDVIPHEGKRFKDSTIFFRETKMQPAGIFNKELLEELGYFPRQYGPLGSGDHALYRRILKLGYKSFWVTPPLVHHTGVHKKDDYPEQHKFYVETKAKIIEDAMNDALLGKELPIPDPIEEEFRGR